MLPIIVSLLIIFLLYRKTNIADFINSFSNINYIWLILFGANSILVTFVRGFRLAILLRSTGKQAYTYKATFISKACNNLLPMRMGELIKIQYCKDKASVPYTKSSAAVWSEFVLDFSFLGFLALLFLLEAEPYRYLLKYLIPGFIIIVGLLFFTTRMNMFKKSKKNILHKFNRFVYAFREIIFSRTGLKAVCLSVILWSLSLFSVYCGLRILLPDVGFSGILGTLVLVFFSVLIPSSPGFIGPYHFAVAAGIGIAGYSFDAYSALPVIMHSTQFLLQTAIGLIPGYAYLFRNDWRSSIAGIKRSLNSQNN